MKIILLLTLLVSIQVNALEFTGQAYKPGTKQLLYTEKHKTQDDENGYNKIIETEYVTPDGKVFAKIKSDFSKDQMIPDKVFEDFRLGIKDELIFDPTTRNVKITRTDDKTKKTKSNDFKAKKNSLAGQGFNNYLLQNFETLEKGKSLPVNFIVLTNQDYFKFDIKKKSDKNEEIIFGLNISNLLFKAFVSEIRTTYAIANKRLLVFFGLSNIADAKGEPQNVEIQYEYPK
jgi:hypothetical protein